MPAYARQPKIVRPRERVGALAAVVAVQLGLGLVLFRGFHVDVTSPGEMIQRLVEVTLAKPPPPPVPVERPQPQRHQAAAPKAEECISYQIPSFRLNGKLLVSFGGAAKHCAFYPGAYPVAAHKHQLKNYDTHKGTIRFQANQPLPAALVRKLVKARIAEYSRKAKATG